MRALSRGQDFQLTAPKPVVRHSSKIHDADEETLRTFLAWATGLRPRRASERLPPSFGTGQGQGRGPAAGSPKRRLLRLHTRSRRRAGPQARFAPAAIAQKEDHHEQGPTGDQGPGPPRPVSPGHDRGGSRPGRRQGRSTATSSSELLVVFASRQDFGPRYLGVSSAVWRRFPHGADRC